MESSPSPGSVSTLAPHRIAFVAVWLVTSAAVAWMLLGGVRETDAYETVRRALQIAYVAALLWYLARTGPSVGELPVLNVQVPWLVRFGRWAGLVILILAFLLTAVSDDGHDLMLLSLVVAMVWILIAWGRRIRPGMIVQGVILAGIAFLAGLPIAGSGFVGRRVIYIFAGCALPMYVAGSLLCERTRLGGIQLLTGRYVETIRSLLIGCILFVPLGLLNAADGSPGGDIGWVNQWWMPLFNPWFSGITEEILYRLMLVGVSYFLLRPFLRRSSAAAVVAAVLVSGIVFGLGHGRNLDRFLSTGLLYGVPMAAVFARRDLEHAVGAHYMVNMIPWLMAFLGNR